MKNFLKLTLIGAAAGLLNGFFGSGGGSLVVPFLEKFNATPAKKAHATAVAVILPLSVLAAAIYLFGSGFAEIKWAAVLCVSAGGLAGGFFGAKLLGKISVPWLHKLFGAAMLAAGVKMLWR